MSQEIINVQNFDRLNVAEETVLTDNIDAAATSLPVENSNGFAADDYVGVEVGSEVGEIQLIDSVTATAITLAAPLTFPHPRDARVVKLRGDQVKLYRASNVDGSAPADGDFALVDNATPDNPTDIQADQFTTPMIDPNGGEAYWYKQTYYHSLSFAETQLSWSIAIRGGDYGHYVTLDEIRMEAGFRDNSNVTDEVMADARESAESEINAVVAAAGYNLPFSVDVPIMRLLSRQLGAAYVLLQDYGAGAEGTNKDGEARRKRVWLQLDRISEGKLVLVDGNGTPLSQGQEETPTTDDCEPREPTFRMSDVY